jgi:hypothetical protein
MAEYQKQEPVVTQQPGAQATPSYKVVTGSEEWSNDVFGCLDGGLEANDHLCAFFHHFKLSNANPSQA